MGRTERRFEVTDDDTARALGSGSLDVLGTPRLLAWCEAVTCAAAEPLPDGATSVGTRVELEHLAASPVGEQVLVLAERTHSDGRLLRFAVTATGRDDRLLATGQVTRVVVDVRRFLDAAAPVTDAGDRDDGAGGPALTRRQVLRRLPRATSRALRGHDLLLYAAGVTFYAALAIVPALLIAVRLLTSVLGAPRVLDLLTSLAEALPSTLGADQVAAQLLGQGVRLPWVVALVSVLPATVYGEGLRRAYVALSGVRDTMVGWRGRLAVVPLLVAAPVLLLAVLAITPLLGGLFGAGAGGRVLGVYLALNVDWLVVSVPLAWTFRIVAPGPMPWGACVLGGLAVGAFVSGFLQGFVLFLSLPIDLGAPFGGLVAVGGVSAVLLWLWLLHLVVLVGWVATREAWRMRRPQTPVVERG